MALPRIYFGHPVNTYNTDLERTLLEIITATFPDYQVENPNQPHHQQGYQDWKRRTGSGMNYYYQLVLPKMDAGIFLPFSDGMWGAGVYNEALFLAERGKPIFDISWDGRLILPTILDPEKRLSIDATRKRVYGPTGTR